MRDFRLSRPFRLAIVALLSGILSIVGTSLASAATPTTLAGETLISPFDDFSVNGTCNAGGASTFTFTAHGPAAGPVLGTFNETGTFSLASPTGPVTGFQASFTIKATGQLDVTGTKAMGTLTGACTPGGFFSDAHVAGTTNYAVTAPFTEAGTAALTLDYRYPGTFSEGPFVVGLGLTSKDQCKNGGYANFIDPSTGQPFQNQGQCIKFFNHQD
jgi:hypothetical protein